MLYRVQAQIGGHGIRTIRIYADSEAHAVQVMRDIIADDGYDTIAIWIDHGVTPDSDYDREPDEPTAYEDGSDRPMPWELADDER